MVEKYRDRHKYYLDNKDKYTERYNRRRKDPSKKDSLRNAQLKFYYGITLEDYNRMFEEQNGCCKICNRHQMEVKRRLNVDHCHETDEVRGLLCNQCNQALGLVKENPNTIKAMLEYIS